MTLKYYIDNIQGLSFYFQQYCDSEYEYFFSNVVSEESCYISWKKIINGKEEWCHTSYQLSIINSLLLENIWVFALTAEQAKYIKYILKYKETHSSVLLNTILTNKCYTMKQRSVLNKLIERISSTNQKNGNIFN